MFDEKNSTSDVFSCSCFSSMFRYDRKGPGPGPLLFAGRMPSGLWSCGRIGL